MAVLRSSRFGLPFSNLCTASLVWLLGSSAFVQAAGQAVINEFHYNSEDEHSLEEFIELHNPGDAPYDLTGHTLANAVTYTFPSGTTIPAGGYVVIAQDPAVMLSKFGVTALGPWTGGLNSSGEEIQLRNGANAKVDGVDYKSGFPWPTMADGGGPSAELINAGLDNNLGSSWRSGVSGTAGITFVPELASGWKYYKGLTQAPTTDATWRTLSYDDTASGWLTGQAGFGYGNYDGHNTVLSDMLDTYTTVYLRKKFTIDPGQKPNSLKVRFRIDDGCVIWINGQEVVRKYVPAGDLAYNATATDHTRVWEEVTLTGTASYLNEGDNVIAVHAINTRIGSSDLSFDLSLSTVNTNTLKATPGAINSNVRPLAQTPPAVTQISHTPQQPTAGVPVVVTASIQDPDGVASVTLGYQLVDPGSYIRKTDAAYATTWTNVTMNDTGANGDATAGDGIYTATLAANLQTHRRLVRYRVTAVDSLGNSQLFPYEEDEQPNFAYFVYNGIPSWTGAFRPAAHNGYAATPAVTYTTQVMQSMPAIHLIANGTDVDNSQYNGTYNEVVFSGTLIQRGVVYDHIQFRNRGQGSIYQSGKNKWKINFNRARDFQAYDNYGRPYNETWNELPINSNASPWAPMHRGSAGIEESSSHRLFQLAGMAALNTQYFQFRVIDNASENGTDQYSGDLWGLYMGFEPTEGNFLDERGLPDGNLYSIEGGAGDRERQGPPPAVNDGSDWTTFKAGVTQTGQTEAWYRANIDLDALYTFLALNRLIGNVDVRPGDNYRFYLRPTDNRWVIIPYDLDMMYIAAHHWGGTMDGVVVAGAPDVIRAVMRHANIAREYRNRCRELLSLVASDGNNNGGQIGQLFAEYANFVNPPGQAQTWADIDAAMWNRHPRTKGTAGNNTGQSNHNGNFYRNEFYDSRGGLAGTVATSSWRRDLPAASDYGTGFSNHEGLTQWFINFATNTWTPNTVGETWNRKAMTGIGGGNDSANLTRQKGYGYKYLEFEANNGGWANANANPGSMPLYADYPAKPTLTSVNTSYTIDNLKFSPSTFSDPQGSGTYAATQYRIAQITAPNGPGFVSGEPWKYEIQPTWTSGELTSNSEFRIPPGVATTGNRYRVRVRHKDTSGNWSYWSEPVQFDAAAPQPYTLVHYWNFNASPQTKPTFSLLGGTETINLAGTAATAYSSGESFAALNARNADVAGTHQRINNPANNSNTNLVFMLPTTGFQQLLLKYETRRSGSGAGTQLIDYTTDGGSTWTNHSTLTVQDVASTAQVPINTFDFYETPGASDNPLFGIRIRFAQGLGGLVGNNRFDNLTLEGRPIHPSFSTWVSSEFTPSEQANAAISGPNADPNGSGITNLMRYALGLSRNESPYGSGASAMLPQLVKSTGRVFRFRYNPSAQDVVWKVQAGPSPGSWTHTLFDSTVTPAPPQVNGWVEVTVPNSLTGNPTADPKMFLRLHVSQAP